MGKAVRLSTVDNPYNPFTDFEDWLNFDLTKHYDTSAVLAQHAFVSDQLSDEDNALEIERAIDEIIAKDPLNHYIKVVEE